MERAVGYGAMAGAWASALRHEPLSHPLYEPALLLVLDAIGDRHRPLAMTGEAS